MKRIFTLLFLLGLTVAHAQELPIKDFVFKSKKELTAKYGKPKKIILTGIDTLLGTETYVWTLKDKSKVEVSYTGGTGQLTGGISIKNFKFNKDTFYNQLGWDKPIIKKKKDETEITGLHGFKAYFYEPSAMYIIVDKPKSATFGKKK